MAITNFGTTAGLDSHDFITLAAFPDFAHFGGGGVDLKPSVMKPHVQQPSPPATSDSSPESSAVPTAGEGGHQTLAEDDDDEGSDSEDLGPHNNKKRRSSADGPTGGGGKRGKASSAERRATHNAIERARRESLNGRFLELANALPTMTNVKRPSKSVIVNKSLEFIYESQIREHALVRENNALRAELDEMRARLHMPPVPKAQQAAPGAANVAQRPVDPSYFGFPTAHHAGQFSGFTMSGPTSAPLPRGVANAGSGGGMFAFGNPFNVNSFVGSSMAQQPTPQSPTTKSESGSEATTDSTAPVVVVKDEPAKTTTPLSASPAPVTASQAEAMAAIHAAHQYQQQQQQLAAFAAAVSQGQVHPAPAAAVGGAGGAGGPWSLGGSFLF